jgi:hypothetical protein
MKRLMDVQNGTYKRLGRSVGIMEVISKESNVNVTVCLSVREKYKSEFNSWSKKTAQSTLEMCRVVYEAKTELGGQEFLKFCNEIGRKGEDATVRKYLKIGEKYEEFYQYADLLPNSWTSIYEITQLPTDVFEALVATENSMANMTGDQIKTLMGKKTEDKSKSSVAGVTSHTSVAPTTAQTSTEVSEDVCAASSTTDATETAVASSYALQNESVTESASVADQATSDVSASDSDRQFATQATSAILERVGDTTATRTNLSSKSSSKLYEVLILFNTIPSDGIWFDLIEEIENVVEKYNLDVEVVETRPEFAI